MSDYQNSQFNSPEYIAELTAFIDELEATEAANAIGSLHDLDDMIAEHFKVDNIATTPKTNTVDAMFDDLKAFAQSLDTDKIATDTTGHSDKIATDTPPAMADFAHEYQTLDYAGPKPCAVRKSPLSSSSTTHKHPTPTQPKKKPVKAKRWRDLTTEDKFTQAVSLTQRQAGKAFSLNFSPEVQTSLVTNGDPLRLFSHRLNRELKAVGLDAMAYAFKFELTHLTEGKRQRLHAHGIAQIDEADHAKLKSALQRAGGAISGKASSRQVSLAEITDADGWNDYCAKDESLTLRVIDSRKTHFINDAMTKRVREGYAGN